MFLGMIFLQKDIFPVPQLKKIYNSIFLKIKLPENYTSYVISRYAAGVPLYSDRNYYDTIGDDRLNDLYIIQIPRHNYSELKLKIKRPVKIFRVLCHSNDNSSFIDWKNENIPISILGNTCNHDFIVSKYFNIGTVSLSNIGPISTSPILIKDISKKIDFPFYFF